MTKDHPSSAEKRQKLRSLLNEPGLTVAPTSYDGLTAAMVDEAGFEAVHFSGFFASAAAGALPDIGLLTMTEMTDQCRRVCRSTALPLIADADDGYGGPLQVYRAVQEFEAAGASAIHIEDQVAPKRCGLMAGKRVIPNKLMREKLLAARAARSDENFVLIARTDARQPEGLARAIERANSYREAGADASIVEGPQSVAEIEAIARDVQGPLIFSWSVFGPTSELSFSRVEELGYSIAFFVDGPLAVHRRLSEVHAKLRGGHDAVAISGMMSSYDAFNDTVRLARWRQLELKLRGDAD